MTAQDRDALKALFETGDTLLQSSFEDLIDSFLVLEGTLPQTVNSGVTFIQTVTAQSNIVQVTGFSITPGGLPDGIGFPFNIFGQLVTSGRIGSRDIETSAVAAGTVVASAQEVSAAHNIITVATPTEKGVKPSIRVGQSINLFNETAVTVDVYGNTPEGYTLEVSASAISIDGQSAGVPTLLLPGQRMIVVQIDAGDVYTIRSFV